MAGESEAPVSAPIVRGEKVFLRPAERADIPVMVRWLNDSETTSFLSMRAPMSEAMEEQWFQRMTAEQGRDAYHFLMCRLDNLQPIGTIGLFRIDEVNGNAGIGITVGEKQLWGQGYGTDAMLALIDFGFGQLRLERMWLEVYEFNPRGRRSYEKCGFVLEGTQRRAIFKRGRYQDVLLMSILRDEWAAQDRRRMWDYNPGP